MHRHRRGNGTRLYLFQSLLASRSLAPCSLTRRWWSCFQLDDLSLTWTRSEDSSLAEYNQRELMAPSALKSR
ncbi:hypothetical protein BDZ89DRAFT_74532 [Hymenopellis radicata]|nr:hypothetical protein BDZ89DRAFT_74532 [Hymenopellis radicata]